MSDRPNTGRDSSRGKKEKRRHRPRPAKYRLVEGDRRRKRMIELVRSHMFHRK